METTKIDEYIIGSGDIPYWLHHCLSPYQKMSGAVGYEFIGRTRTYLLNVGDRLIKDGNKIRIKRKARE